MHGAACFKMAIIATEPGLVRASSDDLMVS